MVKAQIKVAKTIGVCFMVDANKPGPGLLIAANEHNDADGNRCPLRDVHDAVIAQLPNEILENTGPKLQVAGVFADTVLSQQLVQFTVVGP